MKKILYISLLFIALQSNAQSLSEKVASTTINIWKDSFALDSKPAKWTYDMGVILKAMEDLWYKTGDVKYFNYIQKQVDFFVKDDGTIKTYKFEDFNIDNVCNGRALMTLFKVTNQEKYYKAATKLREQLKQQPRTKEGGFWHKKIYPNQMWLDGLYMGEPFYCEYADFTNDTAAFKDIANQFIWMEKNSRDAKTGLLYHAWDESKEQKWANKTTGCSPHFWARAMGWYATALVDVLDYFPENHPKRKELINILNRLVVAVEKQQQKNGLWLDVMNVTHPQNYVEASASCQFVYAIAKGVRKGYIPQTKIAIAKKGYDGIVKQFIKEENVSAVADGQTNLYGTVKVSGLGGKPYRDGSLDYYFGEPVIVNDPKGLGVFMAAASEMEMLQTQGVGRGKTVLLDSYFNSEKKKDITGIEKSWHYKWNEKSNPGFSMFGSVFNKYGATTKTLYEAPTAKNLQGVDVYIIVDADNVADNPTPNYMSEKDARVISDWVKSGGILLLFHNDKGNAEFQNFNYLAKRVGILFNEDSRNKVEGKNYEMGALLLTDSTEIFKTAKKVYLKEISTLKALCSTGMFYQSGILEYDKGDVLMTITWFGKGTVFAVGDPWLYNEYVDGRKLPAEYENFKAANDLVKWALSQSQKSKVKNKK
ncbi:MAG: glycoside hydrolase family 88/105 protein [Chitinophagaceae bacterium]